MYRVCHYLDMTQRTAAQQALLDRLPATFELVEDFNTGHCPPTVVRTLEGAEVFRFKRGDAAALAGLQRSGAVQYLVGETTAGVTVRLYEKQ